MGFCLGKSIGKLVEKSKFHGKEQESIVALTKGVELTSISLYTLSVFISTQVPSSYLKTCLQWSSRDCCLTPSYTEKGSSTCYFRTLMHLGNIHWTLRNLLVIPSSSINWTYSVLYINYLFPVRLGGVFQDGKKKYSPMLYIFTGVCV